MGRLRRTASLYLPPLLLMALIYVVSDQPGLNSGLGDWDLPLRKIAHIVEYGLLWWLWWRALGYGNPVPAVLITLGYAATDELHQTMVEGRVGSAWDWAIDAAGVGVAGAIACTHRRLAARRRDRTAP